MWQPIETAPKTGRHILVCRNYDPGFGYCDGEWQKGMTVAHWFDDGFYPSWCDDECLEPIDVTHWMPLPAPPKGE